MITIRVPAGPTRPVRFSAMAESESPVVAESDAAVTVTDCHWLLVGRTVTADGRRASHRVIKFPGPAAARPGG